MRAALAILVLLLCAGVAGADDALEKLAQGLRSNDQGERLAAYRALQNKRSPALVQVLTKLLPECPDMGQYYGVLVLMRQAPKQVKPALRKLIGSSSVHLRVIAAGHLHNLGDRSAAPVIVKALRDKSLPAPRVGLLLTRIYNVRDPGVQDAVRALLAKDADLLVLDAAIYNIYLVRDRAARDALRGLYEHDDPSIQALAAGCLLVLGDGNAAAKLAEALRTGGVPYSRLFKLKSMLNMAKPVPGSVLAAFLARLEVESDVNVVRALVDLLGEQGYAQAAGAIRKLLDHENALLAKSAFNALTRFPGAVTPETMRALLDSGSDARRLAAADALRRADDESGLEVALEILKSGKSDSDRWEAARVVGGFRTSRVVEPLLAALMDEHSTVRANAFGSLATVLRSLFPYRRFDLTQTGYVSTGSAAKRKAGVAQMRAWWEAHKDADW